MKKSIKILGIITLMILVNTQFNTVLAQSKEDSVAIIETIQNLNQKVSDLHEKGSINEILQLIDKDFGFTSIFYMFNGQFRSQHGDLKEYIQFLKVLQDELKAKFELTDIYTVEQKGDLAVVIYDFDYELSHRGKVILGGYGARISTLKQTNGHWKLAFTKTVNMESEVNEGVCFCEFFESDGNYVAKLKYPNGSKYRLELFDIHTRTFEDKSYLVNIKDEVFFVDKEGEIWLEENGKLKDNFGNSPDDKQSALAMILDRKGYNEHCSKVIVTN